MSSMFEDCNNLSIKNLFNFNTEKLLNMNTMFYGTKIEEIYLSNFNTQNVTDMGNYIR